MITTEQKIIRFAELKQKIGLSRSTIFRLEKLGQFPQHISLGSKSVGWLLSQIESWIAERLNNKNKK